jgi:hypothetical protein
MKAVSNQEKILHVLTQWKQMTQSNLINVYLEKETPGCLHVVSLVVAEPSSFGLLGNDSNSVDPITR